ncbi:MAG: hypothetical protein KF788_12440 [Piscinibacter sp.]|nr:hypothetical protein [Piscinibacter sp.]
MIRIAALAFAALVALPAAARDERHPAPPPAAHRPAPPAAFDARYRHDHYYPVPGYVAPALPSGSVSIVFGSSHFYFHSGVWYSPVGSRFRVVLPPVGVVVPLLPPSYVTLWIGGAPYYYANGIYYAPAPAGYAVVAPPPGAEVATPVPPAPPPKALPEPIVYPRNGQNAAQTEIDRRECNRWATGQPGAVADASIYQRALSACLDGRGYTVR